MLAVAAGVGACAGSRPAPTANETPPIGAERPGTGPVWAPGSRVAGPSPASEGESPPAGVSARLLAEGPSVLDPAEHAEALWVPTAVLAAPDDPDNDGPERPIPKHEVERLRAEAELLAPSPGIRGPRSAISLERAGPSLLAPSPGAGFDSLSAGNVVPPDPEVAVGPSHVVVVVNSRYAVYDKSGTLLAGPSSLDIFFSSGGGTPGCVGGVFDPNVLYDEEADRFILGVDGGGASYCIAVTTGSSPTGSWNRYAFATDFGGAGFDFPHAGVGRDAIYMGANQFPCLFSGCLFIEGRVYAIDKWAMYAGEPAAVVTRPTGSDASTPQPANLHGYLQGTWPADGPHYIFTEVYDGAVHTLWAWDDPFGTNQLERVADLDLEAASGVTAAFPPLAPQLGAATLLESNDWRGLDTEYRNGRLWMTNSIGCNPGGGTVSCVRWAEIDPQAPAVLQAGVFATSGEHRIFPDLAVNHCDGMAVGYTKTGSAMYPAIWATGRVREDAPGEVGAEVELRAGVTPYSAFDGSPYRWGDYTGMTADPDGLTLWYYGEYAPDVAGSWGTHVRSLELPGCPILAPTPLGSDFGAVEVEETSTPEEITLFNLGNSDLEVTSIEVGDPLRFTVDPAGGSSPCGTTSPTILPAAHCTLDLTFHPDGQAIFASQLVISSADPSNSRQLPISGIGYSPCEYSLNETLTNGSPETGTVSVEACQTVDVGPYELAPPGDLSILAGLAVRFDNGTVIGGTLEVEIDPFLALP